MAVSKLNPVLGVVTDNWIQIATSTPTSGTTVSFTSIPGTYRKLWLVTGKDPVTATGSALFAVTVNSLSGTNDYTYFGAASNTAANYVDADGITQTTIGLNFSFNLIFENKANGTPSASFTGGLSQPQARIISAGRIPALTTPITQIDLTLSANAIDGSSTGELQLYGTF
jgi:hypothetical protein